MNEPPSSLHHNVPHRGVDINLSGTDGSFVSNCHSSIYSHETTKLQIQTIIENVPYNYEITRILFNDDKIIENFLDRKNSNNKQIIRKAIGHDNHYHLEVRSAKQKLPK